MANKLAERGKKILAAIAPLEVGQDRLVHHKRTTDTASEVNKSTIYEIS
jgi:hypothetical protein